MPASESPDRGIAGLAQAGQAKARPERISTRESEAKERRAMNCISEIKTLAGFQQIFLRILAGVSSVRSIVQIPAN
jgi:hypothetical protein